jgi:hypothetical protein
MTLALQIALVRFRIGLLRYKSDELVALGARKSFILRWVARTERDRSCSIGVRNC